MTGTHILTLQLPDLREWDDLVIRVQFGDGTAPEPTEPAPAEPDLDPAVAGVLARLRVYGNRAAVDALFNGLRALGFTAETAHSRQPQPPAYLRWLHNGVFALSANTARIDVTRRTLHANPPLRDALLALPGAETRGDMVIVPVRTIAQVEAMLAALRKHFGQS